jgi:hypothetical protein
MALEVIFALERFDLAPKVAAWEGPVFPMNLSMTVKIFWKEKGHSAARFEARIFGLRLEIWIVLIVFLASLMFSEGTSSALKVNMTKVTYRKPARSLKKISHFSQRVPLLAKDGWEDPESAACD